MLRVSRISKTFGVQPVLDEVSFVVNRRDRIGLVGPNGSGKSTILGIISGAETPDSGHVALDTSTTVGYLEQGLDHTPGQTVREVSQSAIQGLDDARSELQRLALEMTIAHGPALDELISAYGAAVDRFESLGGYEIDQRTTEVLSGLGLGAIDLNTPVELLSGGQQTRLGLARILLFQPDLLLLDEPTNHLDIQALEWLEQFVSGYNGGVLIVSHDRVFLDNTVTQIFSLDEDTHNLTAHPGNYSDYAESMARTLEKRWARWNDQQTEIRRMEADIRNTKDRALVTESSTNHDHYRRKAKKVAQKAKVRERRLRKTLISDDRVEKPKPKWEMKLEFGNMTRGGQIVCDVDRVGHAFGQSRLLDDVNLTTTHGERIVLIGPNGSGKSTLLKIVVGELTPTAGRVRIGNNVRIGYMPQDQESLDPMITPLMLIQRASLMNETDARHFLHQFLFEGDNVFVSIGDLSYGERSRLTLAKLVLTGANFLVMDEPINHLDISSRQQFQAALEAFPGTALVATHDRAFIDEFATAIWSVNSGRVQRFVDREDLARVTGIE
ncbi:MAG: ABC-F family ATP-binding cassette domain-containing protein [SAR202 cluster bacterium]|nr:ABC-F family ATP-binding cassette domain-containing protein [SAR202 cluster bacterium]MDP6512492.1 ABC-F family ATP-binding cassette domain-containing protein [SAR202 cluster bacterium]